MEATFPETLISLEKKMWAAFSRGDSQAFRALVLPEALMIVGGERLTGQFYAQAIEGLALNSLDLQDFQVIALGEHAALVNYLASVDAGPGGEDLTGVYQVSSVWVRRGQDWKLIFNQDSTAVRR